MPSQRDFSISYCYEFLPQRKLLAVASSSTMGTQLTLQYVCEEENELERFSSGLQTALSCLCLVHA
jgi:hypothetical protein